MTVENDRQAEKKPRKKLRRWLVGLIVLFLIGLAINGPIARWLVLSTLDEQLQAQGMHGHAEISGTITSGFSFSAISYTGSEGIQSLQIDQLEIDYRLLELFDSKLRKISITKGSTIIDMAKFPENPESDTDQALAKTLHQMQLWASQPAIDIQQLDVTLLNQNERQAHLTLDALSHEAGSYDFILSGLQISDRTGQSTPTQTVQLVWNIDSLTLDRIEVLPDIALENVKLDWKSNLQAEALLYFLKSRLSLKVQDSIEIKLSGGNIDSKELIKRFKLDLPGSFVLSKLDAQIKNWQELPYDWNIEGSLKLSSASYQDYHLTNTTVKLTQEETDYTVDIVGELNTNDIDISVKGSWYTTTYEKWWTWTEADFEINVPKLGTLGKLWKDRPTDLDLRDASVELQGAVQFSGEYLTILTGTGTVRSIAADKVTLPPFSITTNHHKGSMTTATVESNLNGVKAIKLEAQYDPSIEAYEARLKINEANPAWINALARVFKADVSLNGPVQLTWEGSGDAYDPDRLGLDFEDLDHQGDLKIEKLELKTQENPAIQIATSLSYAWPNKAHLKSLNLKEGDWHAAAEMQWDGKRIKATSTQLTRGKELIASLNGSLPYQINIRDAQGFLEQTEPWNLSIKSQPVALTKLREWFGIDLLNQLTGNTNLDVTLSGSPKNPEIKGKIQATTLKGLDDQQLLPLDVAFDFYSKNQQLIFEGSILEGQDQRLTTKGSVPFTPSDWMKDPDWASRFISNSPVTADIDINRLPLTRFEKFIPEITKITGSVTGNAHVSGTIEKPIYTLHLDADVPLIQLTSADIGDIRNIKLSVRLDQTQKSTSKLTAEINGGKFEINGDVDLNDFSKPVFNLTLNSRYALVHRDDLISVRANADLRVKGSIDDATISGEIGIVESLFYKDIELIPVGVPSSAVATVKLPTLSAAKAEEGLPIPAPFSNWKLDLSVRTVDPILIRGNVATGNLTGSLKVGGTLSKPLPQGTIFANRVKAKLPFSILDIERGQIIFNGRDGLNPTLKITGKSTVGAHDVNVFVYGPASSPKTTFSSLPPLPESEVMTLLATGTTTSNLENRSVATFKAFQLFLLKLQQKNDKPNGNKLFKNLLTGVEDLNLNVGEVDPFTGRKFTSGTVEIHPRWHLTAQVDDTQNTRGLIVYVLRFR